MVTASLTVRAASDRFYLPSVPGLRLTTRRKLNYHWTRWERLTKNPSVECITTATFCEFRAAGIAAGLSHASIETVITDILTVMSALKDRGIVTEIPEPGKRLKIPPPDPEHPELEHIGAAWVAAEESTWPMLPHHQRTAYWRVFLTLVYTSGLRLGDVLSLTWDRVGVDHVRVLASKTNKLQRFPLHPAVLRQLPDMPRLGGRTSRVFAAMPESTPTRLRDALADICERARVPRFTPQGVRVLAGREYERAHGGAGRLLLGHGWPSRSSSFYLSEYEILAEACRKLRLPDELVETSDRQRELEDEAELIRAFRSMDADAKRAILTVARSMK